MYFRTHHSIYTTNLSFFSFQPSGPKVNLARALEGLDQDRHDNQGKNSLITLFFHSIATQFFSSGKVCNIFTIHAFLHWSLINRIQSLLILFPHKTCSIKIFVMFDIALRSCLRKTSSFSGNLSCLPLV